MSQAFDDIPDLGYGALGGDAAEELERVTTHVDPKSRKLCTRCTCGRCGRKNEILFDWEEIIIGSQSLVPPNWNVDQRTGTLYPNVGCALDNCRFILMIVYTPAELKRYVGMGIDQGAITKQWAEGFAQQMRNAAGQR